MSIYDIAVHTELSRNTVSKYLKEMYENRIIIGPHLRMKSSPTYREYVYLMKFLDPHAAFKGLHTFPHVQYNALTFGDWNTLVITNRLLDFSKLVGFESMVYRGVKYCTYTPIIEYTTWNQSFERIHERLCRFAPWKSEITSRLQAPSLTWGEDEWRLYHAFKYDIRKKVTPTLRKIGVRYEIYNKWKETLQDYCTIHTGFYPEGYPTYMSHCFFIHTDHEQTVKSLFSLFPTTPVIMEVDSHLLVFVSVNTPDVNLNLLCTLYDMKSTKVIKKFSHAAVIYHFQ